MIRNPLLFLCTALLISCGPSEQVEEFDGISLSLGSIDNFYMRKGGQFTVVPAVSGGEKPYRYEWTQHLGADVEFNPAARVLSFDTSAYEGDIKFSVVVEDAAGATASTDFTISVSSVLEVPPVFDELNSITAATFPTISISYFPSVYEAVDVDLDGDQDLVVQSFTYDATITQLPSPIPEAPVFTFLNQGDNTFAARQESASFEHGKGIHVGDLNSDGYPDLYMAGHGQEYVDPKVNGEPVGILLSNGDGTFQAETDAGINAYYAPGPFSHDMQIVDFNLDQKLDLVVGDYHNRDGNGHFAIFYGNGDGTFSGPDNVLGDSWAGGQTVLVTDANNDGFMDMITGGGPLQLHLNDGSNNLSTAMEMPTPEVYTHTLRVEEFDINNDQFIDYIVTRTMPSYEENTVQIILNKGNFEFEDVTAIYAPFLQFNTYSSEDMNFVDVDNDGDLDIHFEGVSSEAYADLWLNMGSGHFREYIDATRDWLGSTLIDMNGDDYYDRLNIKNGNLELILQTAQ